LKNTGLQNLNWKKRLRPFGLKMVANGIGLKCRFNALLASVRCLYFLIFLGGIFYV
jgi:hypothetical protein